jgi:hypothetical protein
LDVGAAFDHLMSTLYEIKTERIELGPRQFVQGELVPESAFGPFLDVFIELGWVCEIAARTPLRKDHAVPQRVQQTLLW